MKTALVLMTICSALLLVAVPASANVAGGNLCNVESSISLLSEACDGYHYNPCIRTDATCGPWGDAWVYGEVDFGWLQVCVTSHLSHVLC